MCAVTSPSDCQATPDPPLAASARADGGARVAVGRRGGKPALTLLEQRSPWRVLFPRPERDDPMLAVFANTGGGICGGDRAALAVTAGDGASLVATTQAAEKVYRSTGADAEIRMTLTAGPGAWLEWVPQDTILFDRARLRRRIDVDVAAGGRLLAGEMVVYGRGAHGEEWRQGLFADAWRVRRDGKLVWADSLWLGDAIAETLASPAGFGQARATVTAIAVGPGAADLLPRLRERPAGGPDRAAATVVNGVLVLRLIGPDPQRLRGRLLQDWGWLRAAWADLPPRVPRLWLT